LTPVQVILLKEPPLDSVQLSNIKRASPRYYVGPSNRVKSDHCPTGIISPNHLLSKHPLLSRKPAWHHPSCQAAFIEDKPGKRVSHTTQSERFSCTHCTTGSAGLAASRDRGPAFRAAVVRHVAREFSRYSRSCEVSQIEIWTTFGVKVRNWGEGVRSYC
jgi:hypothetical protein